MKLYSRRNGMSTLAYKAQATRVWCDDENLWIVLSDGRQLATPLGYFPRLLRASADDRKKFNLSGGGTGIHWESLDEDISVSGLLIGTRDLTQPKSLGGNSRKHSK